VPLGLRLPELAVVPDAVGRGRGGARRPDDSAEAARRHEDAVRRQRRPPRVDAGDYAEYLHLRYSSVGWTSRGPGGGGAGVPWTSLGLY